MRSCNMHISTSKRLSIITVQSIEHSKPSPSLNHPPRCDTRHNGKEPKSISSRSGFNILARLLINSCPCGSSSTHKKDPGQHCGASITRHLPLEEPGAPLQTFSNRSAGVSAKLHFPSGRFTWSTSGPGTDHELSLGLDCLLAASGRLCPAKTM